MYESDVFSSLADAKNMIVKVGELVDKKAKLNYWSFAEIEKDFRSLKKINQHKIPAAYLIWNNPYMAAAGGDTFIHDMMHVCGFQNIFWNKLRYPRN